MMPDASIMMHDGQLTIPDSNSVCGVAHRPHPNRASRLASLSPRSEDGAPGGARTGQGADPDHGPAPLAQADARYLATRRAIPITGLPAPKPSLQVSSIHDAEYEHHPIGGDDVVHQTMIADAHPMKGTVRSAHGLHCLPGDPSGSGDIAGESIKRSSDPFLAPAIELLELPHRRSR